MLTGNLKVRFHSGHRLWDRHQRRPFPGVGSGKGEATSGAAGKVGDVFPLHKKQSASLSKPKPNRLHIAIHSRRKSRRRRRRPVVRRRASRTACRTWRTWRRGCRRRSAAWPPTPRCSSSAAPRSPTAAPSSGSQSTRSRSVVVQHSAVTVIHGPS